MEPVDLSVLLIGTLLYSAYKTSLRSTQPDHCACPWGVCITPRSTPTRSPTTPWSGSAILRKSMKPVTEAWLLRAYKSMGWRLSSHCTILDLILYNKTRRRRQKRQERKFYVQSYICRTHTKPGFPTLRSVLKITMCWIRRNTQGQWPQYRVFY